MTLTDLVGIRFYIASFLENADGSEVSKNRGLIVQSNYFSKNIFSTVSISSSLNLDELYHTTLDPTAIKQLNLTGLICYYGLHYVAYVYNKDSASWKFVDDNKVSDVGKSLNTVKEKLASSGYRPTLLVFSNPLYKKIGSNNTYRIGYKLYNRVFCFSQRWCILYLQSLFRD